MRILRALFNFFGLSLTALTGVGLLARFIPPGAFWPPAIIALLLPGLLLLTAFFFGFVALKKNWRLAIFPGLVLASSLPLVPQLFALSPATYDTSDTLSMKVLTCNVRVFRDDANKSQVNDGGVQFIRDTKADVALFQESPRGTHNVEVTTLVSAATGLAMRHQPHRSSVATYGNELRFITDHFPKKGYNGFLVTDAETPLGTIRFINAHLESNNISGIARQVGRDKDLEAEVTRAGSMFRRYADAAARRVDQANRIRKFIDESPHPVILGGDFNDVPSSYVYQLARSPRLQDAWVEAGGGLGTTFTGPIPGLRIDYLLVDTSFVVMDIERVETGFSDHRGLAAILAKRQ